MTLATFSQRPSIPTVAAPNMFITDLSWFLPVYIRIYQAVLGCGEQPFYLSFWPINDVMLYSSQNCISRNWEYCLHDMTTLVILDYQSVKVAKLYCSNKCTQQIYIPFMWHTMQTWTFLIPASSLTLSHLTWRGLWTEDVLSCDQKLLVPLQRDQCLVHCLNQQRLLIDVAQVEIGV